MNMQTYQKSARFFEEWASLLYGIAALMSLPGTVLFFFGIDAVVTYPAWRNEIGACVSVAFVGALYFTTASILKMASGTMSALVTIGNILIGVVFIFYFSWWLAEYVGWVITPFIIVCGIVLPVIVTIVAYRHAREEKEPTDALPPQD